ncbi:hypothetical protein [Streptomyces hydrogenans]|uniref:hypothetical protein n=1 Tax=Streptomyces hydrogenans TaxID=1873719 RepID=UPI0036C830EA
MTTRQTRARAAAIGGLALSLALALAGCTADTDAKGTTKPAPPTVEPPVLTDTPPATPDPQAADREAVLKAHASMWTEQMKADAKADSKGTSLEKYVSPGALGQIRLDPLEFGTQFFHSRQRGPLTALHHSPHQRHPPPHVIRDESDGPSLPRQRAYNT